MDDVERTMKHTIEVEENIPMETVTNFDEVSWTCWKALLLSLGFTIILCVWRGCCKFWHVISYLFVHII